MDRYRNEPSDTVFRTAVLKHGIVSVTDAHGIILRVSNAFCELCGFEREVLVGNTHRIVGAGYHPAAHFQNMWTELHAGRVWRGEFCNRHKQGQEYWVSARILPTPGADGEVFYVCFQTDITDYKQAQKALAASEERLQFFMQNTDESAVVIAGDKIVDLTDETLSMFRMSRDQILNKSPLEFVTPDAREAVAALIARGFSEPYEATMLRADGSTFPGLVRGRLRVLDGRPVRLTTVIDITRQKAVEEELRAAKAEAEQANHAKSDFLSAMSHELRTPLNAILGFAQMLELPSLGPLTSQQADCVQEIRRGGRHLLELINDILELSKIEAGQVPISIEPVAVPEVVDGCLALTRPMAEKRGIRLVSFQPDIPAEPEVEVPFGMLSPPKGPAVFADRTRLKQVLTNLIVNAIKYNRPNGTVDIDIRTLAHGKVRISVKDSGSGIHPEKLSELFQPFNRLGAERTEVEGTGIGLALSKKLVELMDGEIGVESRLGQGCIFWVDLQRCSLPTDAPFSVRPALASAVLPKIEAKMLYVEDNPANIRLMEYIAGSVHGLELLTAHTGQLAIELAQVHPIDLVVVDMQLPDLSGIQVIQGLRALPDWGDVPVMALSASATEADVRRALNVGFFKYLSKPIKISEFLGALTEALAGREFSRNAATAEPSKESEPE